nr:delta(3,5)-Delta(2,4)-dienoyl-CoA isomerase [Kwoniella bestiolae CBS 10118]OCF24538.1 delta(3,5)-Delta(2,4)-dienoyl-CoA isomerase [Kwoniella bestiolae CBS 10118]
MWKELRSIVDDISNTPEIRVVVLSSALDKVFTAGLDLKAQIELNSPSLDPARKAIQLRDHVLDFQDAITSLERCRQPIICAMFGTSVGLAIDLACACDIRLASRDTTFGIFEVNVGLAADIGTLQRLPKIVGNESKVKELALTGRKFGAAEAKEIGFVSEMVGNGRKDVIAAAVDMAKMIASKSPIAVIGTKHLINHARDHTIEEGLRYTAIWNASMLQSVDTTEAMTAVMSKRVPQFPSFGGPASSSNSKSKAKL